jgi:uncharacterized protein
MKKALLVYILFLLPVWVAAQTLSVPEPQSPPKLVNDFAQALSYSETQWLEDKLVAFDKESSTQICIVTVDSLHGADIADYAIAIGNKWEVGRKGKNNGVLLVVAISDRKANISTGYGLEGALPDVTCQEIIANEMAPDFKQGLYYSGFDKATTAIIDATRGKYTSSGSYGSSSTGMPRWLIILLLIVGINGAFIGIPLLIRWLYEKISGKKIKSRRRDYDYSYTPAANDDEPKTNSESSSSSGSSNDSFEGYGGGKFGGGGASGSW